MYRGAGFRGSGSGLEVQDTGYRAHLKSHQIRPALYAGFEAGHARHALLALAAQAPNDDLIDISAATALR